MSVAAALEGSALSGDPEFTVVLDLRHPFAYLALGPAFEFAREARVEINCVPLASQVLRCPSRPHPDDDRGVRHKRSRAESIAREIAIYADAQGLQIESPYRDASATAAHLAWLWVRATAPNGLEAFLTETFRAYWAVELEADDLASVAAVVLRCGLDADAFRAWAATDGPVAAEAVSSELLEAGVFQTPAYLVRDEVFYGRQHLPMIRWLLEGREGAVPI